MTQKSIINKGILEELVAEKAQDKFPGAWTLAVESEDEELFDEVWHKATVLVIDDLVATLIEDGFVEVSGMTEQGEMMFCIKKEVTT